MKIFAGKEYLRTIEGSAELALSAIGNVSYAYLSQLPIRYFERGPLTIKFAPDEEIIKEKMRTLLLEEIDFIDPNDIVELDLERFGPNTYHTSRYGTIKLDSYQREWTDLLDHFITLYRKYIDAGGSKRYIKSLFKEGVTDTKHYDKHSYKDWLRYEEDQKKLDTLIGRLIKEKNIKQ